PQENTSCSNWLVAEVVLKKYYLSIMYGIEFVVGLLGNITVVLAYVLHMKDWKSCNIYLFNLSLSDLAFLCTLPMLVRSYASGSWTYGVALCKSNRYILHANMYTSILFLTFISIDRYLLMKYPFREHFLQKKELAIVASAAIWILVTLEIVPILLILDPIITENSTACRDYASSGDPKSNLCYSLLLTFLGFIIPLLVMCFFYLKIAFFLKHRNQEISSTLPLEKPLTLIIMAMVIFSVLLTPYHVMRNVRIASRMDFWDETPCERAAVHAFYIITRPIAFLNSVINPVFYFLIGDNFREMLLNSVRHLFQSIKSFRR
uniref:G-protein coupled receptors family 1 profile domain-containing protein n=1 Tax=Ornithorhynchus anatinus TaxID=9258 RepID=F7FFN8_ORNAN